MKTYYFKLRPGQYEVEPVAGPVDMSEAVTIANPPLYKVQMLEDRSSDVVNFFIRDYAKLYAVKGEVYFSLTAVGAPIALATKILNNSMMGAVWKDKKMRHRSLKGFKWTTDYSKADDYILDLDLLDFTSL